MIPSENCSQDFKHSRIWSISARLIVIRRFKENVLAFYLIPNLNMNRLILIDWFTVYQMCECVELYISAQNHHPNIKVSQSKKVVLIILCRSSKGEMKSRLTISFHRDDLKIASEIPSIQTTDRYSVTITSHCCHTISSSKICMLIQWVSGSTVQICKDFGQSTSRYSASLV